MAKNLTLHYAAGQGAYWMSYCAAIGYASVFLTGRGFSAGNIGLLMAGAALASVPIIIVFLVFQKYFTKGITMGAVKG